MGKVLVNYFDALTDTMAWLVEDPSVVFVGQGVGCAGTTMTDTLAKVPSKRLLEFPVAEDLQAGFCLGLAIQGYMPICIFPRWNFMLCAANQLVNHLDRLPIYSGGGYEPKVIVRVATPVTEPFNPGPQHDDDFSYAFRQMFRTMQVYCLRDADEIKPAYQRAMTARHSTVLVEFTELYGAIPSGVPERMKENA